MSYDYDMRKIKRILRHAKSKISSLNSYCSISPSSNLEIEKTTFVQTTFRGTTHYHPNRTSASIHIIQRAENIVDNFIYEILEKLADEECRKFPTLAIISAFNLAKSVPTDDGTDLGSVNLEEDWYRNIPFQFRRWVLLQHIVELHVKYIKIPWIVKSMIEACTEKNLSFQGFELLKALWKLTGAGSAENSQFLLNCVDKWKKHESWFKFISSNISIRDVEDPYLYYTIEEKYKVFILKSVIKVIIDAVNMNKCDTLITCHSHFSFFNSIYRSESRLLNDIYFQICDVMNGLVHLLKLPIEVAIGLLLQGISCLKDTPKESMGLWCSHLSEMLIDQHIDKVQNISVEQFIQIVQQLESFSYYEAAIKILIFLEHKLMQYNDQMENLEKCQSLLNNIKDRVKLNPGYNTKFNLRYEPMLDSWILCTPKVSSKQSPVDSADLDLSARYLENEGFIKPRPKVAHSNPLSFSYSPDPLISRTPISKSMYSSKNDYHDGLSSSGEETPLKRKHLDIINPNSSPVTQIRRITQIISSPKRKNSRNISIVTPLPRNNEQDELL